MELAWSPRLRWEPIGQRPPQPVKCMVEGKLANRHFMKWWHVFFYWLHSSQLLSAASHISVDML